MIAHVPAFGAGLSIDAQIKCGLAWSGRSSGHRAVVAGSGRSASTSSELHLRQWATVVPVDALPELAGRIRRLVVAWPDRGLIERLTPGGSLVADDVGVCVLQWGAQGWLTDWLAAHDAVDASTGERFVVAESALLLPSVREAIEPALATFVRGGEEAATTVLRILRALIRDGQGFRADAVWAWALAQRCTPEQARFLSELAQIALTDGRVTPMRSLPLAARERRDADVG